MNAPENTDLQQTPPPAAAKRGRSASRLANRVTELDLFRGIAVLLMILDHCMFDLWGMLPQLFSDYPSALDKFARWYWTWDVRTVVRTVVLFVFFSLTGICCSFSRSNLKRGGKLLAVALVLTVGSYCTGQILGDSEITIVFGVLHCLSLALIVVGLLDRLPIKPWVYLAVGLALIAVGVLTEYIFDPHLVSYASEPFFPLLGKAVLGITEIGSDCFPFPATAGQVFVGVWLGKRLYRERRSRMTKRYHNNPVTFVGRHSLWVYFAHQLLLPILLSLLLVCLGYHFSF